MTMQIAWEVDGSESRSCYPHDAHILALSIEGKYRLSQKSGDGDWIEFRNFEETDGIRVGMPMTLKIYEEDSDWDTLAMELDISVVDFDEHKSVVMHSEDQEYHGIFGCQLISQKSTTFQSRFRRWVQGEQKSGSSKISVTLDRGDLAGEVRVNPRALLGKSLGEEPLEGKARRKWSIIADGYPIHFQFDEPSNIPGGDIKHVWSDEFGADRKNALTYLAIEDAKITCYWNSSLPESNALKKYVDSTTKSGKLAVPREQIFSHERLSITKTAILWAVENFVEDPGSPDEELANRILTTVARWLGGWNKEKILQVYGKNGSEADLDGIMTLDARLSSHFRVGPLNADLISKSLEGLE